MCTPNQAQQSQRPRENFADAFARGAEQGAERRRREMESQQAEQEHAARMRILAAQERAAAEPARQQLGSEEPARIDYAPDGTAGAFHRACTVFLVASQQPVSTADFAQATYCVALIKGFLSAHAMAVQQGNATPQFCVPQERTILDVIAKLAATTPPVGPERSTPDIGHLATRLRADWPCSEG